DPGVLTRAPVRVIPSTSGKSIAQMNDAVIREPRTVNPAQKARARLWRRSQEKAAHCRTMPGNAPPMRSSVLKARRARANEMFRATTAMTTIAPAIERRGVLMAPSLKANPGRGCRHSNEAIGGVHPIIFYEGTRGRRVFPAPRDF